MKFSIGIPAYKSKYLKDCINSILSQSYSDFELIIINDNSPENINAIVKQYNDQRIKYYENKKNIGSEKVVDNWNKCLKNATGEFFILMGDDDKLENTYLEEFNKLIDKYPEFEVYHCRSTIIDEDSSPNSITPSWSEIESVYENMIHRIRGFRVQFIGDFVYKTESLKKRGGFYYLPLAWGSDDITSYIAMGTKGVAHTNIPLFNYRINRYTISLTGEPLLKLKAISMQEIWFEKFLTESPDTDIDKIIYHEIRKTITKYMLKRKIDTISSIPVSRLFKVILYLSFNRKEFNLPLIIVFYSAYIQFKRTILFKIYKH